jgi:hypothetical protein
MQYIMVRWLHENAQYPILLYSELDEDRYETRKVDIFIDGRTGMADADFEYCDTALGELPTPELEEIAADPQFQPHAIRGLEFEAVWRMACRLAGRAS